MRTGGYFETEETTSNIDVDDLDDHDIELPDVTVKGDGVGPLKPYFHRLLGEAHHCFEVAKLARQRGFDPETEPEIPFAEDLASRVEALVGPEGVAERIRELSREIGREELALRVSKEVAAGKFTEYESPEAALDGAIRTGLAILTEGILVAPLEGVAHVRVRPNDDGTDYADIYFAGPIRAAGGTGQAMSVLIADVVRRELGLGAYKATSAEIERFKEEVPAYKRSANLQYTPSPKEIDLIVSNIPVGINGEGTEREEVSGNRDLPRVETNQLRGGACLVLAEGLTLKAPKILKHVDKLGLEGWGFLRDFIKAQKGDEGGDGSNEDEDKGPKIKPNPKYVNELVAGRPVFGHPMARGAFRLRYGRARTAGLASTAIHPAVTVLVDDFLAVGTQLKVERPGKGTVMTPCDEVEPPIIVLENGDVVEVTDVVQADELRPRMEAILDMGEMLVPFGEFLENNKPLPASAWCPEWWSLLVQDKGHTPPSFQDGDVRKAFAFAEETGTPLHPRFTLPWHDLDRDQLSALAEAVATGQWETGRLLLEPDAQVKAILEVLCLLHTVEEDGRYRLHPRQSYPLVRATGHEAADGTITRVREMPAGEDGLELAAALSGVRLKAKAPCRIGSRMGRPEKAAERAMSPPVHALFPLGKTGGLQRLVKQAAQQGEIGTKDEDRGQRYKQIEVGVRACPQCETETLKLECPHCELVTRPKGARPKPELIPLRELVDEALARLQEGKFPPGTKGVMGLMSEKRLPEPLEKGILRAKHDISTFKDGTCRFDMTDLPLTHFKPREIGTSVETLRELGYEEDVDGNELQDPEQVVELFPQDIIVNDDCLAYMSRVASFVDDLLSRFYGLKPYYDLDEPRDLIGHLFVGLAPHTSGGVLCRLIGTTRAQGHWGHPFFHAAKRRNCFHGDTEILLDRGEGLEKVALRELVDPHVDAGGRPLDGHGTKGADAPEGWEVLSLEPDTREVARHPVTKLLRGQTEAWVDIQTSTHRSIRVTPDHEVLVQREGVLTTLRADEVASGDQVPVGLSLPREARVPSWNLAEAFAHLEEGSDIRLRDIEGWLEGLLERHGKDAVFNACGASEYFRRSPSRWRTACPPSHLRALVEAGLTTWEDLPAHARLGTARDQGSLPARLEASPDLCRLVGFYLAEGHARSTPSAHQVSFRVSEPALGKRLIGLIQDTFGLAPTVEEEGTKVTVCSHLVYLLFTEVWGAGEGAEDKRVPAWAYGLPDPFLLQLLSGFFDGDGSLVQDPPRLRFYSKNRPLLEDIGILLQAMGLFSRFVPGKPRPPGRFLKARHEEIDAEAPELLDPVHALALHGEDLTRFCQVVEPDHPVKYQRARALAGNGPQGRLLQVDGRKLDPEAGEHVLFDRVLKVEQQEAKEATYCIDIDTGSADVATKNVLLGNGLYQVRCDGDEDCVMLLMDGLLNFSRTYLPRTRGGQMDAPLTLSVRIDPREIDKEAHNIECVRSYSLAFYEATQDNPSPKDVEDLVDTVADRLGGDQQYTQLHFTHDTAQIDVGPKLSAYKTIGSMLEKMDGQLGLARKIRAVDEGNVASRVICDHFLPDIIGNLKAFSKQTIRCAKCNSKFRRIPLAGRCPKCKNTLTMTVHEASVKKYVDVAKKVAEEYQVDAYTRQRLRLAEDAIASLFQNDKVKKATLADFL